MDAGVHSTPGVPKRRRAHTIRMARAVAFPQAWTVLAREVTEAHWAPTGAGGTRGGRCTAITRDQRLGCAR